jgi:hypothetical protein
MRRATLGALCFWRAPSVVCAARWQCSPRRPRIRHRQATPHDSPKLQRVFEFPQHFEGSRSTCSPIGLIDKTARWRVRTARTHPEAPKFPAIHPPPLWTSNPDGGFAFGCCFRRFAFGICLWVSMLFASAVANRRDATGRVCMDGARIGVQTRVANPSRKPESQTQVANPSRKPET